MIPVRLDYSGSSAWIEEPAWDTLALCANRRRRVRLRARIQSGAASIRLALRALGELTGTDFGWQRRGEAIACLLDPVVTVHPDAVFIEGFSRDRRGYGTVVIDAGCLELDGDASFGTTTVDFRPWVWEAIGSLRGGRQVYFVIDADGIAGAPTGAASSFAGQIELPAGWVRDWLEVQAAAARPGPRFRVDAADLLAALLKGRGHGTEGVSRTIRFDMFPGQDAWIVLEPGGEVVPLRGAWHGLLERTVTRVAVGAHLRVIEALLPHALSAEVFLREGSLPSFHLVVSLPGVKFLFGLSARNGTVRALPNARDPAPAEQELPAELLGPVFAALVQSRVTCVEEVMSRTGLDQTFVARALAHLIRGGRAMVDLETSTYRHRELFEHPVDARMWTEPSPAMAAAHALLETNQVRLMQRRACAQGSAWGGDWEAEAVVSGALRVRIAVRDAGLIVDGSCDCGLGRGRSASLGPCEHMLALCLANDRRTCAGAGSDDLVGADDGCAAAASEGVD